VRGIAAYRVVGGNYTTGGVGTVIDYDTPESDADSTVTTGASWFYTAPADGVYHYDAMLYFATNTFAVGDEFFLNGVFDGTSRTIDYHKQHVSGTGLTLAGSGGYPLSAGETIYFNVFHTHANTITAQHGRVCIFRI
jgi:hypothetical protein